MHAISEPQTRLAGILLFNEMSRYLGIAAWCMEIHSVTECRTSRSTSISWYALGVRISYCTWYTLIIWPTVCCGCIEDRSPSCPSSMVFPCFSLNTWTVILLWYCSAQIAYLTTCTQRSATHRNTTPLKATSCKTTWCYSNMSVLGVQSHLSSNDMANAMGGLAQPVLERPHHHAMKFKA